MKKYTSIIMITVLMMSFTTGCKKSNDPAVPRDYTSSIKDKTWWGMFTYTNKDAEYYSVHFNADNTFLWSQFSGDFSGQWAIINKELTMTFDLSKAAIKADLSDSDKLLNMTDNTDDFEMNTGQLIADPKIFLDNTEWEGKPVLASNLYGYQIIFKSGLKVDIQKTYFYPPSSYTSYFYPGIVYKRSASGAVIRAEITTGGAGAGTQFFGILISVGDMRGCEKNSNNQWKATKM